MNLKLNFRDTDEDLMKISRPRDTLSQLKIRNCYAPEFASYRMARLRIGLNCIWQEMTTPKHISIPIPFMRKDKRFIRYKSIIPPKTRSPAEFRLQQERIRFQNIMNSPETSAIMKDLAAFVLKEIDYISTGVQREI